MGERAGRSAQHIPAATQGRGSRVATVQKLGGPLGLFVIERSKRHMLTSRVAGYRAASRLKRWHDASLRRCRHVDDGEPEVS
jgi:hypothetical protein